MAKLVELPESTKMEKDCKYLSDDGHCNNSKNYLRPHKCGEYCVEKVDKWLRSRYPDLKDDVIKMYVARATKHQTEKPNYSL